MAVNLFTNFKKQLFKIMIMIGEKMDPDCISGNVDNPISCRNVDYPTASKIIMGQMDVQSQG